MAFVSDTESKRNGNYLTPAEYQILKESFERRLIADIKLSHSFLRVGIAIKWHMNQHSGDAWPGVLTIMREARVCRRTVYNAIKYFEKMGHIGIERKRGRVNHYFPAAMTGAEAIAPQSLGGSAEAIAPGGVTAIAPGGVTAIAPEPSIEPLREPSPYGRDEGITPVEERLKEEEGGRERQEVREEEIALTPSDSPLSLVSESPEFPAPTWKACFRFAREDFPDEPGESLVGREWKRGASVEWVWDKLTEAKETGQSLGRIFWQPGE